MYVAQVPGLLLVVCEVKYTVGATHATARNNSKRFSEFTALVSIQQSIASLTPI